MRLTKDVYLWVKTRAKLRADEISMTEDQDDIAEEWGNWRDKIIGKWGDDISPRQVDILADYALRWMEKFA